MAERAGGSHLPDQPVPELIHFPGPVTSSRTVFTATSRPMCGSMQRYTMPIPPSPNFPMTAYRPTRSITAQQIISPRRSGCGARCGNASLRSRFRVDCLCRAPGVEARRQESQCDTKVDGIRSARLGASTPAFQQLAPDGIACGSRAEASRGVGTRGAESLRHAGHVAHLSQESNTRRRPDGL